MKIYLIAFSVLVAAALAVYISLGSIPGKMKIFKDAHKLCPVVNPEAVPFTVLAAFQNKYPSDTVITWFNKDNSGYCAYFETKDFVDKIVQFTNSGAFINEETDIQDNGDFKDSAGGRPLDSTGCICETVSMN